MQELQLHLLPLHAVAHVLQHCRALLLQPLELPHVDDEIHAIQTLVVRPARVLFKKLQSVTTCE